MSLLKLAGPAAPAIAALSAKSPVIARRLVSWTHSYAHAVSAFLQARGVADPQAAKELILNEPRLEHAGTTALLRMAGFSQPDRLLPLLDRLTTRFLDLHQYREWDQLLMDRKLAGFIGSQRKLLTTRKLEALARLPRYLRSRRIMKTVAAPSDVVALEAIVDTVCRLCPDASVADVCRSLRETKADFDDWLRDWLCRANLSEPPFPGGGLLVPLRTGAEIKETSRIFRNCLLHFLDDAVGGRIALYVWKGKEPALVSLRPLGQVGWRVDEIKGIENKRVPAPTRRRIIAEITSWGCFPDQKIEDGLHKWLAWNLLL